MPKLQKIRQWLVRHTRRSLIWISLIVLSLDVIFVAINYYSSREALHQDLLHNAMEKQREFGLTLQMTYRNMMQMTLYISQNQEYNQLFLKGKQAILREGGGPGGKDANQARQELLNKVKPAWDKLTQAFDVRQLHYHLGPGSLSFLRVHKPQKYGDRMDNLRYIIVDTNREKTPRFGFETGRIYSGLRGVYPIWAVDPTTKQKVYVGALEAGTSFKQILPEFSKYFDVNVAVLLTRQHVESKMWPEFIDEYFNKNPTLNYYIESTTSEMVRRVIAAIKIQPNLTAKKVQLYRNGDTDWAVYYFPLRDYAGSLNQELPPSGLVLIWSNATELVHTFKQGVYINILYAFIAFLIVEAALIWFIAREKQMAVVEQDAKLDALTNISNRGNFEKIYAREFGVAKKMGMPVSLIICDIDFFKQYNDTYGHLAGDTCLKHVAAEIKLNAKRDTDFVARYGGEEFVIVLPNTNLEKAIGIANDIRQAVEDLHINHKSSEVSHYVTLSMGVACSDDVSARSELIHRADQNLYKAKEGGRNRVYPTL